VASKIKFGSVIKVINAKPPLYEVRLDDGKILRINHSLIKPERQKLLNPGCRLSISERDGKVEWASTDLSSPSKPKETQSPITAGKHIVTVKNVEPARGIITVETKDGKQIRVRLPLHGPSWQNVFIGRKFELEVTVDKDDNPKYTLLISQPIKEPPVSSREPSRVAEGAKPQPPPPPEQPKSPPRQGAEEESKEQPRKDGRDSAEPSTEKDKVEADWFGIDPAYLRERQKENHRYEIMAFLAEHLNDDFIEWYQMRPEQAARFGQPQVPLNTVVNRALHSIDNSFKQFYIHQARALDSIRAGRNLVVVTQTASGKTLCYNPAIFEHFCASDRGAHALYLFPLNALMLDQKDKIDQLSTALAERGNDLTAEVLRGGLGVERRHEIARNSPNILATNPEMLGTVLNEAQRWQDFLSGLRYVVIDEVHTYRGILGMHMAGLIRRLLLTVRRLGAEPQFILSSATVSNPMDLATRLTALPETSFDLLSEGDDGSQQAFKHWAIINPDSHQDGGGYDSYLTSAAMAMVELLSSRNEAGKPSPLNTILFAKSIRDVNKAYQIVQENLKTRRPDLLSKVRKYVSADLSVTEKREIYQGLKSGSLVGVVSTNALEAGIDIGRLDACVIAGFPFWVMRMRQMAGRVGRNLEGLVLFVPQPVSSIDQYYRNHPGLLLTQPPEVFVVDPANPYITRKHINAAAYSLGGVSQDELGIFGPNAISTSEQAISDGVMKRNGKLYYGTHRNYKNIEDPYAIVGIRSQQQRPYTICREDGVACDFSPACLDANRKGDCDRQITVLDQQYAYRDCHPGAMYESMDGALYRVISFDDRRKVVGTRQISETTLERTFVDEDTTIDILGEPKVRKKLANGIELYLGEVLVTRSFTGYYTYTLIPRRRCRRCKKVFDEGTIACPQCKRHTTKFFDHSKPERHDFEEPHENGFSITLKTVACWMTVPAELESRLEAASPCKLPGESNRVKTFLQNPIKVQNFASRLNLSPDESVLIEKYYEEGGKILRGRRSHEKETVLYPGVYGQCLIYSLREKLPESRSLEIYQRLTGYPVTDDLKHICRKCQTSVLFPAMHTLEHTVQMRYPSIALGDSSDVAGHTMLGHPQTGAPTIFWYDNYQGGLGAADKIYDQITQLLQASENTLSGCTCTALEGCPHCTQIGSCDIRNEALSKLAARSLIGWALDAPFKIPFEPFAYQSSKKAYFEHEYKENEHVKQPHGIGTEAPAPAAGRKEFDPYQILRLQHLVHDPVLNKAYEVRSAEITKELPQISAVELNQAYFDIYGKSRPKDWNIQATMTPHQILEILPEASLNMIQRIYRIIAREVHPDTYKGSKDKANQMMKLVNNAYQRLQKEKQQKEHIYDDIP
jgi:ATP-dependent helicase YprA (DUF1998 family)